MRATTTTYEMLAGWEPAPASHEAATRNVKNAALVVAAPLLGLAFAVGFPLFGLAALAWMAVRALREAHLGRYVKNVLLFAAAPFVGLAYVLAFPLVGLGTLVVLAARAARERPAAA
jgi:hypothetical protein